jgi:hypothetical protein
LKESQPEEEAGTKPKYRIPSSHGLVIPVDGVSAQSAHSFRVEAEDTRPKEKAKTRGPLKDHGPPADSATEEEGPEEEIEYKQLPLELPAQFKIGKKALKVNTTQVLIN